MTTQCVVRAAERPSAAARELAPPEKNETRKNGYARYKIYDNVVGRGLAPAEENETKINGCPRYEIYCKTVGAFIGRP